MHSFLRAIGFGNLKKNKEIDDLLNEVIEKPTRLQVAKDSNESLNLIITILISVEPKVQRQQVWKWKNIQKRNLMPESVMI